jgi:hypothetical protein
MSLEPRGSTLGADFFRQKNLRKGRALESTRLGPVGHHDPPGWLGLGI